MKAEELKLLELLDFQPEEGLIRFKDRRMLIFDADALGLLRKELIECLGPEGARGVLTRFGYANGYRDALTSKELFDWENDREWWFAGPAMHTMEGKLKANPQKVIFDKERGEFRVEAFWERSYEAEQHLLHIGKSEIPVCWTLVGYASGHATACFGEEVYFVEKRCVGMGDDRCEIIAQTAKAWGEEIKPHLRYFQSVKMQEELSHLTQELEKKKRELAKQRRELLRLRREAYLDIPPDLVAKSPGMRKLLDTAARLAGVDTTVLITGESGTGKERVARFIHERSPRSKGSFVALNCGALPEQLLDSELFGHRKGSFTGATEDRKGLFEAARGGTLFLDEVGETSPATQVKLLRALQEREIRPLGQDTTVKVNVRVIAASNQDLSALVKEKRFRTDLYYRLKVVVLEVPPLRDRREDILPLARLFVEKFCADLKREFCTLDSESLDLLLAYPWPGNVRELENAIERAVVLTDDCRMTSVDLPPEVRGEALSSDLLSVGKVLPLREMERRYILSVLERNQGNRAQTARDLQIGYNTLWRKLGKPEGQEDSKNG
ncbi:sigma-54-dependent Fis family transcriptional regulator [candidate division TA06 bacterium]|nr:sigma-54-dependent Fis family transcriptional regulator [candidate division TA06 bacterium]